MSPHKFSGSPSNVNYTGLEMELLVSTHEALEPITRHVSAFTNKLLLCLFLLMILEPESRIQLEP